MELSAQPSRTTLSAQGGELERSNHIERSRPATAAAAAASAFWHFGGPKPILSILTFYQHPNQVPTSIRDFTECLIDQVIKPIRVRTRDT